MKDPGRAESPEFLAMRQRIVDLYAGATGERFDADEELFVVDFVAVWRAVLEQLELGSEDEPIPRWMGLESAAEFETPQRLTEFLWMQGVRFPS